MAGRPTDIDPDLDQPRREEAAEAAAESARAAAELAEDAALETEEPPPEGPLARGVAAIRSAVKLAPAGPGVYRMIGEAGEVLYVGKAKSIKKRIVAYTRPTGYDPRIERMIAATASLEFVTTATETEALLLEANLIKRLRPLTFRS